MFFLLFCFRSVNAQFSESETTETEEYTTKVGDSIFVYVGERPELSGTKTVDRIGNITLPPPIGSVKVLGLTADQIRQKLTEQLKEYIIEPTVFVSISKAYNFTVHIVGEVLSPSFYDIPEGTSLQELVTQAGGFTKLADKENIKLIRKKEEGKEETQEFIIDFSKFIKNADLSANPALQAKDIVVVPRISTVGKVSVFGAVANPGTVELTESLSLMELLSLVGGATEKADLQKVSILSSEEGKYSWGTINLESFLSGKVLDANPIISPGVRVFVPKKVEEEISFMVNVMGQVRNPKAYTVPKKARLFDAIYAAGGFIEDADIDRVTIIHTTPKSPRITEIDIGRYLTTGNLDDNPLLAGGDIVFVPLSKDAKKITPIQTAFFETVQVSIIGEVKKPDIYQVSKNSSVLDIIKLAGGPTAEANLKTVTLIRGKDNFDSKAGVEENRLKINIEKVLTEGEFNLLPPLHTNDTIFVPKIKEERNYWRTFMQIVGDISTLVVAYYLITGQRFR